MSKKQVVCTVLFRVLLPLALLGAAVVRYNGFSLAYLLLLLTSPLLPGPSPAAMSGHTGRYLIAATVLSSLMLLAQVIFQGVLLGKATDTQPYGSLFANCSTAERVLRQIGLQRLQSDDIANIVRLLAPDIGMCIVSLIVTVTCFKIIPRCPPPLSEIPQLSSVRMRIKQHTSVIVNLLGQVFTALLLGLSGVTHPSLLSATYFLSFLAVATWWGCYKSLGKRFAVFRVVLLVYSAVHLVLLYLYQFQFFQDALDPTNFYARLFGLTGIVKTNCDQPWMVQFYDNKWPVYVSPGVILLLYMILAIETQRWIAKNASDTDSSTHLISGSPRRRPRRHRSDVSERQVLPASGQEIESISMAPVHILTALHRIASLVEDSHHRLSYSSMDPTVDQMPRQRRSSRIPSQRIGRQASIIDSTSPGQRSPLSSIFTYVMKQSYAASLIIMMAWSITFHSWLTFVYLLSACVIWMIPAKRKICLMCSPLIVSYAEGLLLMQYIYGFNLHEPGELPIETASGYKFKEIGLVTYAYPCRPLSVQVFFTFFFWLTLRQYMREIKQTAQDNAPSGLPLRRVSDVENRNGSTPPTPTMQQSTEPDGDTHDDESDTKPLSSQHSESQSHDVVDGYDSETMKAAGRWMWHLLCKYWIIVCAGLFLVMAVQEAVIYRIIYMFLFCYFVITFKLCYRWWRLTINVFWWVTIVYSMLVLCIIYTYQFDKFPDYWQNSTGFTLEILHDIGLQQFDIATLFVKLLTPTSFLIIIILQLHYFQTPFLRISDISRFTFEESTTPLRTTGNRPAVTTTAVETTVTEPAGRKLSQADIGGNYCDLTDSGSSNRKRKWHKRVQQTVMDWWNTAATYLEELSILLWRVAEVHWLKVLAFVIFISCLVELSAINVVFMILLLIGLPIPQLHFVMTGLCLVWAAVAAIAKMMFQLTIIKHDFWYTNCSNVSIPSPLYAESVVRVNRNSTIPDWGGNKTDVTNFNGTLPDPFNKTIDNAEYIGLKKTDNLSNYLQTYILIIFVIVFHGIIWVHQKQYFGTRPAPLTGIIFKDIKRPDADRSLINCLKFFVNYAFFKFGLEICFVMTVVTMVIRLDAFSLVYGLFLGVLLILPSRKATFIVWPFYIIILVILLLIQYLACVGLPLSACWGYPWNTSHLVTRNLQIFLYLPNYISGPDPYKLIADFFQLLFVCLQWRMFYIENTSAIEDYGGGDNKHILVDVEANCENPVEDFLSCKDSYLDYIKTGLFHYLFWVTLVIVFVAGTARISLFCMGYLVGVFFFLWFGEEMLIKPLGKLLKLWGILLGYNYFVIMCKSAIQLVGCVYLQDIVNGYCWLVQLLSIVCLRSGHYVLRNEALSVSKRIFQVIMSDTGENTLLPAPAGETDTCTLPQDQAGLTWDTICFVFLIFQLRIYKSHYFRHVVTELTIQNKLAARGAELINGNLIKSVEERKANEAEVLSNIKRKMERIKMRQQKLHSKTTLIDSEDHYQVIRSGDYYMFEGDSDDDIESSVDVLDTLTISKDIMAQSEAKIGPLEILNAAMTGGTKKGLEMAQHKPAQERLTSESQAASSPTTPAPTCPSPTFPSPQSPPSPKPSTSETAHDDGEGKPTEEDDECPQAEPPKEDLCTRITNSLKLAWAVIGSSLDYLIGVLEDISHEYRQVAKVLNEEKEAEKRRLKEERKAVQPVATTEQEIKSTLVTSRSTLSRNSVEPFPDAVSESIDTHNKYMPGDPVQVDVEVHGKHPGLDLDLTVMKLDDKKASDDSHDAEEEFREKTPRIFQLFIALFDVMISRSEVLCYFAMILNHLVSASLLSLPYPISVFIWAMLSVPRPTKTYWVTVITYTEAVVVVKYLFQFGFFPWNVAPSINDDNPFWPPRIIGIEKKLVYAAFDLFLLVCLFIHRSVLKRNGLWKDADEVDDDLAKAEQDHEISRHGSPLPSPGATSPVTESAVVSFTDQQSLDRNAATEGKGTENEVYESESLLEVTGSLDNDGQEIAVKSCKDEIDTSTENSGEEGKKKKGKKQKTPGICDACWQPFRKFYRQMTNPKFNAATDVYALMFFCDFINFFIIVFGYKSFGPSPFGADKSQSQGGNVVNDVLQENKVPMPFLMMLLLQFVLIIIDRALYLRKQVIGKFLYQILLVALIHLWMFFILPAISNRQFTDNTPAQLWYFVKCIYFGLSAYQIRSGYPTRILGNFLTKKYNYMNLFLFKGFLAVPFLLELRALMDWMWTDTTLALTSWLEMEDIYANIFQLKCWRRAEEAYPTPRGQLRKLMVKYGMGGLILFLLVFIIWFPLLLFSLADTVLFEVNPPISCDITISLGGYQPIFQMSSQQQFIRQMSEAEFTLLMAHYAKKPEAAAWLTSYKANDVSVININGESTANWGISPPSQRALLDELRSQTNINLIFAVTFGRKPKNGIVAELRNQFVKKLDPQIPGVEAIRNGFANMINGTTNSTLNILDVFPRYMRLPGSDPPQNISTLVIKGEGQTNVTFQLKRDSGVQWWELSEYRLSEPFDESSGYVSKLNLTIITFSDRVAPSGLSFFTGYGIIGLYVSFILLIGKALRIGTTGLTPGIQYAHLPFVDRMLKLCIDFYISREMHELRIEEEIYAQILFLYRSPETRIKVTRRPIKFKDD